MLAVINKKYRLPLGEGAKRETDRAKPKKGCRSQGLIRLAPLTRRHFNWWPALFQGERDRRPIRSQPHGSPLELRREARTSTHWRGRAPTTTQTSKARKTAKPGAPPFSTFPPLSSRIPPTSDNRLYNSFGISSK